MERPESAGAELYRSLGATPVINGLGSVTLLGGSTPSKAVREAMDSADDSYVPVTLSPSLCAGPGLLTGR
jgi:hypothetical protein